MCAFCSESADQAAEEYNLQKITLLREISLKTGVQVRSTSSFPVMFCAEEEQVQTAWQGRPFPRTESPKALAVFVLEYGFQPWGKRFRLRSVLG